MRPVPPPMQLLPAQLAACACNPLLDSPCHESCMACKLLVICQQEPPSLLIQGTLRVGMHQQALDDNLQANRWRNRVGHGNWAQAFAATSQQLALELPAPEHAECPGPASNLSSRH